MALSENTPLNETVIWGYMADVSAASSTWAYVPVRGKVIKVGSILAGAITGANSALTTEINGTAVTGGAWTVTQSGSAAGDVDSAIPTAANAVKVGDAFEWISDGASSTTMPLHCFAIIRHG
jgi:hypothetical protein